MDESLFYFVDATMHLRFFRNLQRSSLTCREHGTLQTCYLLWSTVRFSVLYFDNPPSREHPLSDTWGLSSFEGLSPVNLHLHVNYVMSVYTIMSSMSSIQFILV